jgi:hypothetical protein
MNLVGSNQEAKSDNAISEFTEYKIEVTTYNFYDPDGNFVQSVDIRVFSVFDPAKDVWISYTIETEKAFQVLLEEFHIRGFEPAVEYKVIEHTESGGMY